MKKINDFILRNAIWLALGACGYILLNPAIAEINTLFLVVIIEALALALSGVSVYSFTKINFIGGDSFQDDSSRSDFSHTLGFIFLGVHICVGLTVLGVYIAQFSG